MCTLHDPGSEHSIPIPPWWRIPKPSARRAPLTREAIIEAALRVLDDEGLDSVSMRRVAEELGTGAGSPYWHVGNKEELLELLLDRVSSELELPEPQPDRWQEQLKEVARDMRTLMKRHRGVARISLGRIPIGPNLVRVVEWLLRLLRAAGVPRSHRLADGRLARPLRRCLCLRGEFALQRAGQRSARPDPHDDPRLLRVASARPVPEHHCPRRRAHGRRTR